MNPGKWMLTHGVSVLLLVLSGSIDAAPDDGSELYKPVPVAGSEKIVDQVNSLVAQAESLRETNPKDSLMRAERALQLAERIVLTRPEVVAAAVRAMGDASSNLGNYRTALAYYERARQQWKMVANEDEQAGALLKSCIAHWRLSEYDQALPKCLESEKFYIKLNKKEGLANVYHNLGIISDLRGYYDEALDYHHQAHALRKELGKQKDIADSLNNIGIIYYFKKQYKKALEFYHQSLKIRQENDYKKGIAKSLTNIGLAHQGLGEYTDALNYSLEALEIWKTLDDKYEMANISNNIGEIYIDLKDFIKAHEYLTRGFKLAKTADAKELMRENHEKFSKLYVAQNDYKTALDYYKQAGTLKDEIFNEESAKILADMETKYETEKKEQQITLLQKDNEINTLALARQELLRNSLLGGLVLVFIIAFIIYGRYRFTQKVNRQLEDANHIIQREKEKSDRLLLNILPAQVANDLKETGKTEPQSFENVTVYFSDVVGFTNLSTTLEPKILIDELNDIFTAFDNIIEKNDCERVKTIGDAYLCVCGMPAANENHAENVVRSAVEIIHYMHERNKHSEIHWQIRIGIHTGKVVGGVVGVKKYIYDVFGDTINTASRMESNSQPMRINISATTYELIKDKFKITPRGVHAVKGKGEMQMFFVEI